MVLIQLLLPLTSAGPGRTDPLRRTRDELVATFGGVTAYVRSPAKGLWTSPAGETERDDVVMIEVVSDTFDRSWWRGYVDVLRERFQQDAIHARALPVELLDAEGA